MTICEDRSFDVRLKTPLTSALLREAAELEEGAASPNGKPVGTVRREQLRRIAEIKYPDLNAASVEGALSTVQGTARSMGIRVRDRPAGVASERPSGELVDSRPREPGGHQTDCAANAPPSRRSGPRAKSSGLTGLASGLVNTSQQMGGALGLAALAAVAAIYTTTVAGRGSGVAALNSGYHVAFLVGAGCVVLGALTAATLLRLPKEANPE